MIQFYPILLFILIGSLTLSCTQLPSQPSPALQSLWQVHQSRLGIIQAWRLNGSISITATTPEAEEKNWNARVYWQQEGESYQIRFNAPLGQGAVRLDGNDQQVIMRTAKNETFVARDPETLILETLKLEIPVTHLLSWIRGLPAPHPVPSQFSLKETGNLHVLEQDGWNIEYLSYIQAEAEAIELPKRIYLYNSRFEVNIVISEWQIAIPKPSRLLKSKLVGYPLTYLTDGRSP